MNRLAEKIVGAVMVIFLVLTVSAQTLINRNVLNPVSAVDVRDDISVYESSDYYPRQYVVTLNVSDKDAKIMVNGYYIKQAIAKNGDVSFEVYTGDVVECDARDCKDDVEIKLIEKDETLSVPASNYSTEGEESIIYLFKVDSAE